MRLGGESFTSRPRSCSSARSLSLSLGLVAGVTGCLAVRYVELCATLGYGCDVVGDVRPADAPGALNFADMAGSMEDGLTEPFVAGRARPGGSFLPGQCSSPPSLGA